MLAENEIDLAVLGLSLCRRGRRTYKADFLLARNICLPRTKLTSLCSVFLFAAAGIHTKKYQVSANELLKSYSLIRKPPCRINSTAISVLKNFGSQEPKSFADTWYFFAERTRFELVVRITPYVGLANRWFQPLTHLSGHPGRIAVPEKVCKYRIFLANDQEMPPKFLYLSCLKSGKR